MKFVCQQNIDKTKTSSHQRLFVVVNQYCMVLLGVYPLVIMSIKSQKSLNEECSEIIERSYSVRSASDESLSGFVPSYIF